MKAFACILFFSMTCTVWGAKIGTTNNSSYGQGSATCTVDPGGCFPTSLVSDSVTTDSFISTNEPTNKVYVYFVDDSSPFNLTLTSGTGAVGFVDSGAFYCNFSLSFGTNEYCAGTDGTYYSSVNVNPGATPSSIVISGDGSQTYYAFYVVESTSAAAPTWVLTPAASAVPEPRWLAIAGFLFVPIGRLAMSKCRRRLA